MSDDVLDSNSEDMEENDEELALDSMDDECSDPEDESEGGIDDEMGAPREIPEEFREIARKYKAHETLSDDELDLIADTAIEVLRNMLGYFDAGDANIDEYDGGEGELILDVSNADLAILIGRHGRTLDAFQHIFTVIVNGKLGFRFPIVVDIEGYKNRRRQKIQSMAINAANKATMRGYEVKMHPMKPYERRIVHLTLRNNKNVTTHSEGVEPSRFVVVVPNKKR